LLRVQKSIVEDGDVIQAPRPRGLYWTMQNVVILAKANSQCPEWSEGLHLIHTLPTSGDIPVATGKHHLFKRSTCKNKPVVQSNDELKKKLDALKDTVTKVSTMTGFTEEDKIWWCKFFLDRFLMAVSQHSYETAPSDPHLVERVTSLFWGTSHIQVGERRCPVVVPPLMELTVMGRLERLVTPRTETIRNSEWGRDRQVGYITVKAGESPALAMKAAVEKRKVSRSVDLRSYFTDVQQQRGIESEFVKSIKVRFNRVLFKSSDHIFSSY
jgi:hypothetical protein